MKVLFLIPTQYNVYGGEIIRPRLPHLGIAYLSAYLKKEGHTVEVYDSMVECDGLFFKKNIFNYDIIGISLYSFNILFQYTFINKFIASLRKCPNKNIPVVVGGPHVTVTGKEALITTGADFAIPGEGELTFSELIRNLDGSNDFSRIKGLIWRDKTGAIVENATREFIEDIDVLPFPDFSVFKRDKYINFELNEIPINTSRGCPFQCIFCTIKFIGGERFRPRKPENIINEIIFRYKNGIRNFYISDDLFNLDIKRAEEICDLIIKNNLKIKFIFQNGLKADYITQNLVEKLKMAGCTTIVLSAESGNNSVLKAVKKNITVEQIKSAIDIVSAANINFIVNFIIGHPTETYSKAMDSIALAKEIVKKKNCITIMFFNLVPYPSTELFEWVEKNGKWLFPKEKYLDNSMSSTFPVFETKEFTLKERAAVLENGNAIHNKMLLFFIFGRYFGSLVYIITRIRFIRKASLKFSFDNNFGQRIVFRRFLRKLYNI